MDTQIQDNNKDNPTDITGDEFPYYDNEPAPEPVVTAPPTIDASAIAQGQGSRLDSDTVDGVQLSTASHPSPNTIVPLLASGKFPTSVLPAGSGWVTVATNSPSAASSTQFTGLTSGITYKVIFNLVQNTSNGVLQATINSNTGANYKWAVWTHLDSTASAVQGNTGDTKVQLTDTGGVDATEQVIGEFVLNTCPGTTTKLTGYGSLNTIGGAGLRAVHVGFRYSNSTLSTIEVKTSAGTFTGSVSLMKYTP